MRKKLVYFLYLTLFKNTKLNDVITIKTYPTGFKRIFAYRDYIAYDSQGDKIAQASSTWTLINTDTRKTATIPEDMFKFKADPSIGYLDEAKSKLDGMQGVDFSNKYKINYLNLDWNGHVNNVFLAKCILESLPDHYFLKEIQKFYIHYKSESFLHDRIKVEVSIIDDKITSHQIIKVDDHQIVAIANCKWK